MTVNTEIQDYSEEFKNFINSCVKKENKEDVSKNLHEFFRSYYEQSANLDSIYKKIKNFSRIIFVLHPIPPKEEIREGTKIADAANGLGYTDKVLRDINDYNGKKEEFDDKFCLPFFYESIDILKIDKNFVDQACESHSIAIIDLAPFVIGKDDKGIDKFDMYIDMIDWPEAVQFAMDRFMQRLSKNYVNNLSLGVQCAFLTPAVVFNRIITFYEKKTLEYTLKANNVNEETGYLFFAELNDCDPETIKSIAYPKYKSFIDSNWKHEVQKEMLLNALGIGKAGKKHLEKYRNWALQKIVEAANHLDINSAIQQTNLRLLIRWYPQIDQNGEDSYSAYYKVKNMDGSNLHANLLALKNCLNLRMSEKAKDLMEKNYTITEENKNKALHFEHNPPVNVVFKQLVSKILELNYSLTTEIVTELFHDNEYTVMVITDEQRKELDKKFKASGEWDVRCKVIDDNFKMVITDEQRKELDKKFKASGDWDELCSLIKDKFKIVITDEQRKKLDEKFKASGKWDERCRWIEAEFKKVIYYNLFPEISKLDLPETDMPYKA